MYAQSPSPLFTFPTEIRLAIYDYALAFPVPDNDVTLLDAVKTIPLTQTHLLQSCPRIFDGAAVAYLAAYRHFWTTTHIAVPPNYITNFAAARQVSQL